MNERKWANPMCTPEMINECNRKIVESNRQMKSSPEGREKFMKMMEQTWRKLQPAGHDTLGWE